MRLQRLVGNRAVARLLGGQAALQVGAANDPLEREADVVADRALRALHMPGGFGVDTTTSKIRRATAPTAAAVESATGPAGGEVDEDTNDLIAGTRSGGRTLPAGIQGPFEAAMGVPLGGVRVHAGRTADELSERLGATAFTTGRDVFFRGGLPDVTTSSGAHVLAHELAHVVQQRSGAPVGRIRRKVGFEFEVGQWTLEKLADHKTSLTRRETGGDDMLLKADTWAVDTNAPIKTWGKLNLMGDKAADATTHIEWVIDPPCDETDAGRAELAKTMDQLSTINTALISNEGNATIKRRKTNNPADTNFEKRYRLSWLGFGLPKRVLVRPFGEMEAEPQMTAGIRLTELAKMMEQMSSAAKPGESTAEHRTRRTGTDVLMGKRAADIPVISGGPAAVRAAFAKVPHEGGNPPAQPSNRLTGLVALLRSYVINAQRSNQYAKGLAPFLAKTDFGRLFNMLPEAGYYHENLDEWVALVLEASGVPDTDADTPLFTGTFQFIQPDQMTALRKLTKRLWIFRLALDQVDLCTPAALERTNMKAAATDLYGFGSLGKRTDVVGAERTASSAILEFRRMAGGVPYTKWKSYALELFDYVRALNARQETTYAGQSFFG
jgi:Domain of unknown function (DUF4157)